MKKYYPQFILVLILCSLLQFTRAQHPIAGYPFSSQKEITGKNGMIVTSQPLATQTAMKILQEGGSAIDAAIAANATLGLLNPAKCGIGGDLFAIVWDQKTQRLYGINGSGRSPRLLTIDYFLSNNLSEIPSIGPLPVTIPGCVDAWFELHQKFGKLSMEDILMPAIELARKGFSVSESISQQWEKSLNHLSPSPNTEEIFSINGKTPQKGEIFRNPTLAHTYEMIANEGRDHFYNGPIAETISRFIQLQGGFLCSEDFAMHQSEWVNPIVSTYRDYEIWELPVNGQDITALIMLNILEGFNFSPPDFGSPRHLHLVNEAKKLAFEDGNRLIDYTSHPAGSLEKLLSKEYAARRRSLIDTTKAGLSDKQPPIKDESTFLAIADQWGNMVSFIQSNTHKKCSGMIPPGLGFMLQNQGSLFSLEPGKPNEYAPAKRPIHNGIPAFITQEGKPFLSFGITGSHHQPQEHVQIIMNLIDFDMNLENAAHAPRFLHSALYTSKATTKTAYGTIKIKDGFTEQSISKLIKLGHTIDMGQHEYGTFQGILFNQKKNLYISISEHSPNEKTIGY